MDGKLRRIVLCLVLTLVMTLGMATPGLMESAETGFDEPTSFSDAPDTSDNGSDNDKSSDSGSEHEEKSEVSASATESSKSSEETHSSDNTDESSSSNATADDTPQQVVVTADSPSVEQSNESDAPAQEKSVEVSDAEPQAQEQTVMSSPAQEEQAPVVWGDAPQQAQTAGDDAGQQAQEPIVWGDAPQQEASAENGGEQEPTAEGEVEQQTQESSAEGEAAQQEQAPSAEDEAEQQTQEPTTEGEAEQQQESAAVGEAEQQQEPVAEGDAVQQVKPVESDATQENSEVLEAELSDTGSLAPDSTETVSDEITFDSGESGDDADKEKVLSLLNGFLSKDPKVYDNDLALIAAKLSLKAYDKKGLQEYLNKDLGFAPEDITTYNYGLWRSYCFGIATMPYQGEGALPNSKILVLAIRGSATVTELIGDALSYSYKKRHGYDVIGVVETFWRKIEPKLPDLKSDDTDYRILVTGHSLGGATANLAAAEFNNAGQENVFCYTFGAINSIKSKKPITEGYENIHNVYNDLDTFSPYQQGSVMRNGAGTKFGKFGHLDAYTYDHRSPSEKTQANFFQTISAVNHSMDNYVADVAAGRVTCKADEPILLPSQKTWGDWFWEAKEKVASKFRRKKNTTVKVGPPTAPYNDKNLTKEGVVFMASDNPAISGALLENKESLTDFLKTYTLATGDKLTYSAGKNVLAAESVEIVSIDAMKEKDGDHLVMIDVLNHSSRSVNLELSQLALNDAALDCGVFRSDVIPAGERMIVTIKAEALLELAGQSETQINIDDVISFVLSINDTSGEEISVFDVIEVPLEPAE